MARSSKKTVPGARNRTALFYSRLLKGLSFFWSAVVFGILVNVVSGIISLFVPKEWATLLQKPIEWAFQNLLIVGLGLVILGLLTFIAYQGKRFTKEAADPTSIADPSPSSASQPYLPTSEKDLEQRYLQRMIREHELLRLTGIPAGLVAPHVRLDEVFIAPEFFPRRLPSDYPLTGEEYTRYHDLLKRGQFSEEMEHAFVSTEKSWMALLKKGKKVSVSELWSQLTREHPTAVIQGYPGMGKSTLLARLTLHMARCSLNQPDPTIGERLVPARSTLIPILLLLKDYAIELEKALANDADLSVLDYVKIATDRVPLAGLYLYLVECLHEGHCLVMLDGLDEVSDLKTRTRVKQAIERFILDYRDAAKTTFNRFLVTSRVAGYDVVAFADYLHFTITELTPEQIDGFLPRWCRANVRHEVHSATGGEEEQEERITQEAGLMARRLSKAVHAHQGVRKLTENPLLLTLLSVMQQNSIELPSQRVELYAVVTRTLLENRNIAKGLTPIPEAQAMERLGPIAYQMQASGNSFARQREVKESLTATIKKAGGTPQEVAQEVEHFLLRIRERGGLFVIRTGDYFGFFHRTFQEYFAARFILNQIKRDPDAWIATLVDLARSRDDLWREPFLLAVAYQSSEDELIARKIIQALLDIPQGTPVEEHVHDLLLAAECVIEAKPFTIGSPIETQVARRLVQVYEQALKTRDGEKCDALASMMQRWLLSLPEEAYRPAPVIVLSEMVSDSKSVPLQRATLTLLVTIMHGLVDGPPAVFEMLVPPLLAVCGQPAIDAFRPVDGHCGSSDFTVIDLALTALSWMGRRGPAGALLKDVRAYFKDHPEQLRQLARCSLACGMLITPTLVPLSDDNYQHYEAAIGRWIELRDSYRPAHITERDVSACLEIHGQLLDCAEEASYPTAMHLVKMLQVARDTPSLSWRQSWKQYMLEQLASGHYSSYQEVAQLWAILFPDEQELASLTQLVLAHYNGSAIPVQRYAQRFIAFLGFNLRNMRNMGNIRNYSHLIDGPSSMRYITYLTSMIRHRNSIYQVSIYMFYLLYLKEMRHPTYLINVKSMKEINSLKNLRNLQVTLLTHKVAKKAQSFIPATDMTQMVDLLGILLGRILEIQEEKEIGQDIENEVQQIVKVALDSIASASSEEVREAVLDILCYLPMRSANEVEFVLQVAEKATDERIQKVCTEAIRFARLNAEGKAALETGKQSGVKVVREVVEEKLKK